MSAEKYLENRECISDQKLVEKNSLQLLTHMRQLVILL